MATPTNQFRLKLAPSTAYNFYINWGDGSSEIFNQTTNALEISAGLTHTYPTSGSYILSITENVSGGFPRIFSGPNSALVNNDAIKITDIIQWGTGKFSNMVQSFQYCYNLSSVPTDNGTLSSVSNFDYAWNSCNHQKFKTFPQINTSNCKSLLDRTWSGCSYLTAFPLIDTSKVNIFDRPWQLCRNLLSFPAINTLSATTLTNTWENCEKLTTFPLISTNNVTSFSTTWSQCYALTSFPQINTSKATTLNGAWYNCNKLKDFPLINTLSATNIGGAWSNCTSLTSFPLIDTRNVNSLYSGSTGGAWNYCSSLSTFPSIDTSKVTDFTYAWAFCTSLTSFPFINTTNANKFTSTWNGCNNLKDFPALDFNKAKGTNNFNDTWNGCTSLTSFPSITAENSLLRTWKNCTSLTALGPDSYLKFIGMAWETFQNCRSLVVLPNMDTLSATDLGLDSFNTGPWNNCISLTSFPLIDTRNSTSFYGTWQNCYSLSASDFPTLNMSKMTDGTNCFLGVKLTTSSYSTLLSSICATNTNNTVTFHGGNSQYNNTFGLSARNHLVNVKGWTITDGGVGISAVLELNDGSGNLTQEDNSLIRINT
jgi:hypothetical protein